MSKRNAETHGGSGVDNKFRLPRSVWPRRYNVTLTPAMVAPFKFTGSEVIEVEVREPVDKIVLNAKELEIHEATVTDAHGTTLVGTVTLDEETELATISFAGTLAKGEWKLFVRWTGEHNTKLRGFYRSSWTDKSGKKHTIVSTQFESTDARACMPCFDEPEFKATLKSELIIDEDLTAISNTRVESETVIDDGIRFIQAPGPEYKRKKSVKFKESRMPLSTYFMAWAVGPYVVGRSAWVNGVEVIIWCLPGQEHLTEYALECCCTATAFFEKENEHKFDGDVINEVPIPEFEAGAMENHGAIFYRLTDLLIDLKTATHAERRRVKRVTSHEHAHMDDGDVVTMPWWDGLCNNESYATFKEVWCTAQTEPSWNALDEFANDRASAMDSDSLNSTHPIYSPVNHPDDAQELFDVISYEKGCSVLFQIQQFIGPEVFRQGSAEFTRRYAYGNPPLSARWNMLEWAAEKNGVDVPVRKVMDAWMLTAGHPLVTVTATKDKFISLSQHAFRYLHNDADTTTWPVPVTLRIVRKDGSTETQKFLLNAKTEEHFVGDYDYVVVNAEGFGVYRVAYAPNLREKIFANLKNLSVVERFNVVNDTWAQVTAGKVETPVYVDMLQQFKNETDPNVWGVIIGSFSKLHGLLSGEARTSFEKLVRELAGPVAERLGWKPAHDESLQTTRLRASVLSVLGTIGQDPEVRAEAAKQFESWKKSKTSIDSNLLPGIVSTLAYCGDKARYDEFFNLFKAKATPQEEKRFMLSLAQFRDAELLRRTMGYVLDETHVQSQDASSLVIRLMINEVSGEEMWDYLRNNWQKFVDAYPVTGPIHIAESCGDYDTPEIEAEVKEFFAKTKVKSGEKAVARALEMLRINVQLRQSQAPKLAAHLAPRPDCVGSPEPVKATPEKK
ncbi:MAG TPA: M1 family metallopeptidase [Planktothrix sp.]|jgi:puromycin-sensitive aminopeptidase